MRFSHWKSYLPLMIFIIIAVLLWRGLAYDPHQIASPLVGRPIPMIHAANLLDDQEHLDSGLFKNQISLLNVFASWCVSCRVEHATMMAIAHQESVQLIGFSYKDRESDALAWLKTFGNPYQRIFYDPNGDLGIRLGVYGTPETFLIDQYGVIRYKKTGPITEAFWHETLAPMIKQLRETP